MKILVTGASGQLGKKIIDALGVEHQLILTDARNMDITDINAVRNVVEKEKPDYIIHCAAYTAVDKAEENVELCRKINSFGTKNIALIALLELVGIQGIMPPRSTITAGERILGRRI